MDAFKACYGMAPNGHFSFYKYSPQKEKFIGFDQAYVRTELDDSDFYKDIKKIASGAPSSKKYAGYFLQFKVVEERTKKLKSIPTSVSRDPPFYGIKLSTRRDLDGNLSQHELLRRIRSSSKKALVYYACPMLFDKLDLYVDQPDLDKLRLVDIESSGSDFTDNQTHHIFFEDQNSQPVWCSDPLLGRALTYKEFFALARETRGTAQEQAEVLIRIIDEYAARLVKENDQAKFSDVFRMMADFLYVISYGE